MLDGRVLGASQVEYKPFGKPPLKRELGARVVVPKGHKRAHEFREGARHGDVVLRHAVRDAGLLRVHRGVAEHQGPS